MYPLTHAALVDRARHWLHARGCIVVLAERGAGHEIPDAIGWKTYFSILIECNKYTAGKAVQPDPEDELNEGETQ